MDMYHVLIDFVDIEDGNYLYHAGDTFPRMGVIASEKRIEELAGTTNKLSSPVIAPDETTDPAPIKTPKGRRGKKDA